MYTWDDHYLGVIHDPNLTVFVGANTRFIIDMWVIGYISGRNSCKWPTALMEQDDLQHACELHALAASKFGKQTFWPFKKWHPFERSNHPSKPQTSKFFNWGSITSFYGLVQVSKEFPLPLVIIKDWYRAKHLVVQLLASALPIYQLSICELYPW